MYIQEYFKKKEEQRTNPNYNFDGELEIETMSKILNKSKEEVTPEEKRLLIDVYNDNNIGPGNNFTDEKIIMFVKNLNYCLAHGYTYEEAYYYIDGIPFELMEQDHKKKRGYIQDYFQKKMNYNASAGNNEDLERETVSIILGKSKEEVTPYETSLLSDLFYEGCIGPNGNNYTDERFRANVQNVKKYLEQGMSYDEAFEYKDVTPKLPTPVEKRNNNIQDYFVRYFRNQLEGKNTLHDPNFAREVLSRVLDVNEDQVTEEQIRLLDYINDSLTMHYDGGTCNDFSDADFRERLLNMNKHMERGLDINRAIAESWRSPDEMPLQTYGNPVEPTYAPDDPELLPGLGPTAEYTSTPSKYESFHNKYPSLFDENGNLKDNSFEFLDALLEQHAPQLINKENNENKGIQPKV